MTPKSMDASVAASEERKHDDPKEESPSDWFSFLSANEELLALFDGIPCGDLQAVITPDENWGDYLPRGQVLQLTENDLSIQYRKPLGSGAFCNVYPVYLKHPTTLQFTMGPVALKKIKLQVASDTKSATFAAADLRQEAKILTGLGHDNVIDLYGVSDERRVEMTKTFLVMDILKDTLESRLGGWAKAQSRKKTTPASVVSIRLREVVFGLVEGMEYLHSKQVLFRDLKPDNVGFSNKDIPKIFDFGLAIKLNPGKKCHGRTGTILYMAPEVGSEEGYGFPADVYSFGILLWQTITTKIPFQEELSAGGVGDPVVFFKKTRPSLKYITNKELQALLAACWAANPDDRPTFTEIRSRVREIADNNIVLPQPAAKPKKPKPQKPKRMLRMSMFTR